jgi:hypothetical protein
MESVAAIVGTVDPKAVEEFLSAQEEVVDASVWIDGGELRAHVTLAEHAQWDHAALRDLCSNHVGVRHTPQDFVLLRHRSRRG